MRRTPIRTDIPLTLPLQEARGVVALAEVLAPSGDGGGSGGAGAGRSIVGAHSSSSIVAHMYNDGGEEIEVSAGWPDAPCRLQAAAVDQACRWQGCQQSGRLEY